MTLQCKTELILLNFNVLKKSCKRVGIVDAFLVFEPLILYFSILFIPTRFKKHRKISYQKCIFILWQISLFKTKIALKIKGGVGWVAGRISLVSGVEWPKLFLWAKRTPSNDVINEIFWNFFPPISNPARQLAWRKVSLLLLCFQAIIW